MRGSAKFVMPRFFCVPMLKLREDDETIELLFKGRVVLRHTRARPVLSVGWGEPTFNILKGNWSVSDKRALSPLRNATVEQRESITLRFDRGISMTATPSGGRLILEFHGIPENVNRLELRLPATRSEAIYGCGEQFSRLNLRGKRLPLWVREKGVGRSSNLMSMVAQMDSGSGGSWDRTYYPQPSFVTSEWWYCVAETSGYCRFDFTHSNCHLLEFWQVPGRVVIDVTDGPVEALRSQSDLLGRPAVLPDWTWNGMWLGVQGGSQAIERKLANAREAGVKVGALWVQDWVGKRDTTFGRQLMWNWEYNSDWYPDLPTQIGSLAERGIRFLGYINPFLAIERPMYKEASRRGLCVKRPDGSDYLVTVTTFPAAILDLTNPETVQWIRGIIRENMLGIGMSGWMADFGEYLPTDTLMHDGRSGTEVHNEYPVLWSRINADAIDEAGLNGRISVFMRAGWLGTTRYTPAFWGGDQLVDWSSGDGIRSTIPASLSFGYSGGGIWHTDLGGYTSLAWKRRSRELFMRWAEMAAFAPVMRTHEGNRPDSNWQFDSSVSTLLHLARMSTVFTALAPYHQNVVQEYVDTGIPPIRHLAISYPEDRLSHVTTSQFLYGPDILVAPVLRQRTRRRGVYLPEDRWVHLWTGKHHSAGRHQIDAPIGYPPVFYRAASVFRDTFERITAELG